MSPFRYTINRQTYTKISGIPQPEIEEVEGLSDMDNAAKRIVTLAMEDPGVVFQVCDMRGQHFFSVYSSPEEGEQDLLNEVLEALHMFDQLYTTEATV